MSNGRHSYVHFYPSDWIAGTARMGPMHRLVYFEVCCYIWDKAQPCPEAELPLMLSSIPDWRSIVDDLLASGKLTKGDDGIANGRAMAEATRAEERWRRKSEAGKRGAESRWHEGSKDGSAMAQLWHSHGTAITEPMAETPTANAEPEPEPEPEPENTQAPSRSPCPQEEILAMYHDLLPELRRHKVWTGKRQAQLRARWREDPKRQSLDYWRRFFGYVRESDFLMGRSNPRKPGDTPFMADLEFLTRAEIFARVIEGKYHRGQHG